jgi:hypothetical protein
MRSFRAPWRDKEILEKRREFLIDEPDYEWLMIDASRCKNHPQYGKCAGRNLDMNCTKEGSTQKYT